MDKQRGTFVMGLIDLIKIHAIVYKTIVFKHFGCSSTVETIGHRHGRRNGRETGGSLSHPLISKRTATG